VTVAEAVFPMPESQLQPNTGAFDGSVYSDSRHIS